VGGTVAEGWVVLVPWGIPVSLLEKPQADNTTTHPKIQINPKKGCTGVASQPLYTLFSGVFRLIRFDNIMALASGKEYPLALEMP